jgi:hypothetical protein
MMMYFELSLCFTYFANELDTTGNLYNKFDLSIVTCGTKWSE